MDIKKTKEYIEMQMFLDAAISTIEIIKSLGLEMSKEIKELKCMFLEAKKEMKKEDPDLSIIHDINNKLKKKSHVIQETFEIVKTEKSLFSINHN